jgi:hypothetical protein
MPQTTNQDHFMLRKLSASLLLALACTAQAAEHFDGKTWWDTVKVLADDKFEGRDTGSPGERQAQAYIVGQLGTLRIEAAGTNGYYQAVKLRTLEVLEADSFGTVIPNRSRSASKPTSARGWRWRLT